MTETPPRPFTKTAWFYALLYLVLSLGTEIFLLLVGRLRIPQDNRIIGPIVLIVPSALAAWGFGYRSGKAFTILTLLTAVLTFALTIAFGRVTGIKTGLAEPIVVRALAGFLAIIIARPLAK